jgi:hypothetical protein
MAKTHRSLLVIDGFVNLLLGLVLVLGPTGLIGMLGLPGGGEFFYTTVLGAVLIGIGIALLLSLKEYSGLGLLGAIAVNLCGSTAVALWLLVGPRSISPLGAALLWTVAIGVFVIAVAELATKPWAKTV